MTGEKDVIKKQLVAEIIASKGFKNIACSVVGLSPRTFRCWIAEDPEFRAAVDDAVRIARDYRDDIAEQKLFENVQAGDTTAIIFYCKTRLKGRGFSEKPLPEGVSAPEAVLNPATPIAGIEDKSKVNAITKKKIAAKKSYITRLLKKQGKYTPELSMQVKIAAQLLVRVDMLADEIFDADYKPINVEISREGNERQTINPKDKLYKDLVQQSQKALRALGMNTDSRERKTDNDGFGDFLKQFSGDK